jgi:hypothetical protein
MIANLVLAAALLTAGSNGVPGNETIPLMTSAPVVSPATGSSIIGTPAPTFMTSCSAHLDCAAPFTSGTVSCTGVGTCTVSSPLGVLCDSTFVPCTCDQLPDYCAQNGGGYDYCTCRAAGHNHAFCVRAACI